VSRRAATGRSAYVLDSALSNRHEAVIGLLKVNLLAISPKEFCAYSPHRKTFASPNTVRRPVSCREAAFIAAQGRAYEYQRYRASATEVVPAAIST
jgi:hypothetical protein